MVNVKNNSKKVIYIGKRTLMPGAEIEVADSVVETPAIKIFEKSGKLAITKIEEKAAKATTKATKTETTAETQAEAETTAKASTKKSAAKKTTEAAAE